MHRLGIHGCLIVCLAGPASAAADDAAGIAFFEKKIRPVLVEQCYSCHSAGARRSCAGGLRLDTRDGLARGRRHGPGRRAGQAGREPAPRGAPARRAWQMPPKGKLPDAVIADFERWVEDGRPGPARRPGRPRREAGIDVEAGRKFWAFQPPRAHPPPRREGRGWPRTDIDRFILAAPGGEGAAAGRRRRPGDPDPPALLRPDRPAADARGGRRVRRRHVARTPSSGWSIACSPRPHFGERWGRHWLDVARFAESLTLRGFVFKDAWRYRDYVIDAFNADMPFDRFVREQLAGDLLPADDAGRPPPAADRHRRSWPWATPTSRSRTRRSSAWTSSTSSSTRSARRSWA